MEKKYLKNHLYAGVVLLKEKTGVGDLWKEIRQVSFHKHEDVEAIQAAFDHSNEMAGSLAEDVY